MVAGKLHQRLKEIAAEMLGYSVDEIETSNASYYVRNKPQHAVSYLEVIQSAYEQGLELKIHDTFNAPKCEYDPETSQGTTYLQYTYGAVTAEVEVDTETGKVQVDKMVSVEGQIEGGTVQGLGYGIMEELVHKDGVVINASLADYYIPTSGDIPEIKSIIVEYHGQLGPYGAKVIGEPPIVLPAAAIVNAIDHAIGIRLTELPATPDRVLLKYRKEKLK